MAYLAVFNERISGYLHTSSEYSLFPKSGEGYTLGVIHPIEEEKREEQK